MRLTLKAARTKAKCSKVALAATTGLHRSTITRLEAGEITDPHRSNVLKLERALSRLLGTDLVLHFPRMPR